MAAPVFTDEELESLRRLPEIGWEELFRFFTLTPADSAFIDRGRDRGPANRLGLAVAVRTLPWLGFVSDHVASAPPGTGGPDTPATDIRIGYACADWGRLARRRSCVASSDVWRVGSSTGDGTTARGKRAHEEIVRYDSGRCGPAPAVPDVSLPHCRRPTHGGLG